ncbi:hypothetical protein SESBI_19441 [Sesbania bispinosa]|nr:hypothetical protein SESBI_19441 [Sesbania bispinosa]
MNFKLTSQLRHLQNNLSGFFIECDLKRQTSSPQEQSNLREVELEDEHLEASFLLSNAEALPFMFFDKFGRRRWR